MKQGIQKYFLKIDFKDAYDFSFVGKHDMTKEEQLCEFAKALQTYSQSAFLPMLKNWSEAFEC